MKSTLKIAKGFSLLTLTLVVLVSCSENKKDKATDIALNEGVKEAVSLEKNELSKDFKAYWYAGKAEITSYKLEQARYGEMREGNAVLIYVTEPFLNDKQVKADGNNPDNIPVLKLNSTKNYLTGIYPYSIMNSSFYPVHDNQHALKLTFSSQEWCGQVYTQLNNRAKFEVASHSYFESEADQELQLDKAVLENEIWNKIRINPENLPQGNFNMIPSLEFSRLTHKELKSYSATASLTNNGKHQTYEVNYPELKRTLKINFSTQFPYTIESWSDSFISGYGANAKTLTSTGTKIKTLNTPYWRQNGNKDLYLRDSLGI
ncbi:septum formation inhibitor Maf [Maribacter sp. MJ134]|uniref:septum formation inhibitor Maf n=1 Tax=Maribacter sp. MJ134 TaxID=2496865 RepID=UPI000F8484DE|nr:septum formation inhibitor Maf [Maribacter sp. MJ134]AZQ58263.1 septum formation inhibitor Maf [Maribacter sp. MJ134]